jgi:hypothetical protein
VLVMVRRSQSPGGELVVGLMLVGVELGWVGI